MNITITEGNFALLPEVAELALSSPAVAQHPVSHAVRPRDVLGRPRTQAAADIAKGD